MDLPVWAAVLISVLSLALGWVIYDQLCKSRLGANTALLCALGFAFLVAASWGYTQVFSGRGAYIHAGALIGTIMVANVFFVIIPNQKIVVADLIAGRKPDPALGEQAKQRSLHNNYLTLPVLFLMISNHYPLSFATRWNWLIVAVVIVVGAVIRHFYNMRHAGRPSPWWTWGVATVGMALVVWLSAAPPWRRRPRRSRGRSAVAAGGGVSPRSRTSCCRAAACATPPSRCGRASPRRPRASASTRPR